jgi:hypothetical protein
MRQGPFFRKASLVEVTKFNRYEDGTATLNGWSRVKNAKTTVTLPTNPTFLQLSYNMTNKKEIKIQYSTVVLSFSLSFSFALV